MGVSGFGGVIPWCIWVDKDDINGVPIGVVTRDCSPEGRHVYVVRANYEGKHTVGNYKEGDAYAEFEWGGAKSSDDWECLVSNEDVVGMNRCNFINEKASVYGDKAAA